MLASLNVIVHCLGTGQGHYNDDAWQLCNLYSCFCFTCHPAKCSVSVNDQKHDEGIKTKTTKMILYG